MVCCRLLAWLAIELRPGSREGGVEGADRVFLSSPRIVGYPIQKAARVAVQECIDFSERVRGASIHTPSAARARPSDHLASFFSSDCRRCLSHTHTCTHTSKQAGNASSLKEIDFVLFSEDIYRHWISSAEELLPVPEENEEAAASSQQVRVGQFAMRR